MRFEFLPAFKGDCFLIHAGTDAEPCLILVDGGPSGTYQQHLRPHLMQIRQQRGLDAFTPLVIDLVIVSHVDDDHINGVIELFREVFDAKQQDNAPLFEIRGLWHNSFDTIVDNNQVVASTEQFGLASLSPVMEDPETDEQFDAGLILQSIAQGNELRDLATAIEINIEINEAFGGGLVKTKNNQKTKRKVGGVTFTVVGPRTAELKRLQTEHDAWLKKQIKAGKPITPGSMLQSMTDTSVPNLSSIVLIADDGQRKALLTGDARGDYILKGLEETGQIPAGGTLKVDLLKMPHHGSDRNVDESFLSRIDAPKYLLSGNGEHGNPERETLSMLNAARPGAAMELFLTYTVAKIDPERKKDWDKERAKELRRLADHTSTKPARAAWSNATNALATLIPTLPASMKIKPPTGPVIVL